MWEFQGAMLTAEDLVRRRTKTDVVLPTKCPKSFSPTGAWLESKQLQNLLDATKALIAEERVERENALALAEWDENLKVARVTRVVGKQFEKFGHEENMTIFLNPEEALYLLETNHLQLLYGGVSMSIQQAYTVLIGPKTGCTFAEYMVFSHLLKNGFKVLRHCAKRTITRYERLIGLCQGKQKNKKSKRKCNIPVKEIHEGKDKKGVKEGEKIETKNERSEVLKNNNTKTQKVANDVKYNKSGVTGRNVMNIVSQNMVSTDQMFCAETNVDSHSSSQSDIEILSEKSVCKTEESLEYDITEYSSYASEDSDCQVIFSTDAEVLNADSKRSCLRNKVIEEINLSDSDENNVCRDNIEDNSHVKIECSEVDISCNDTEAEEYKTSHEEQNNSKTSIVCENFVEESHIDMGSSILENNEENHDHPINPNGSNILTKSECVNHGLLTEETLEQNNSSVIHYIGKDALLCENHNKMCVSEDRDVKEGIVCDNIHSTSLFPPSGATKQVGNAALVKKESNSNIHRTQKEPDDIEIIELDDETSENGIIQDKITILKSFPNSAGCNNMYCDVPPQRLRPPNVSPVHQSYNIVIDRLQDPRYGGNPRKKQNILHARCDTRAAGHQNVGRVKFLNRYGSRSNRQFNRRYMNSPRHIERQDQSCNYPDMHREETFPGQMIYSEQTPIYSPFQPTCAIQREQNAYPHFSGHASHALPFYPHSRANLRPRGYHNREMYNQNAFRGYSFRNSSSHRFPRRKGRGSRTAFHDRYVAARETGSNEVLDARGGNYIPYNLSNTEGHSCYEQERRTQDHGPNQKRFRRQCEDNANSAGPGRKRSRGEGSRYYSSSGRSQELTQFMHLVHNDHENTVVGSTLDSYSGGSGTSGGNDGCIGCGGGGGGSSSSRQEILSELIENVSALARGYSTDNTSSSGNCSSSTCGSSDESMSESTDSEDEADSISVLLKPNDMEDIDNALKSLEIVRTVKLKGMNAVSDEPLLTIKFDLYQPSTPFRRSDPPVPDFRVIVMQPDQYLPTSRQLAFLEEGFDDDVPLLFAIASLDSVAFYLQSVVNLPNVSNKEKVQM